MPVFAVHLDPGTNVLSQRCSRAYRLACACVRFRSGHVTTIQHTHNGDEGDERVARLFHVLPSVRAVGCFYLKPCRKLKRTQEHAISRKNARGGHGNRKRGHTPVRHALTHFRKFCPLTAQFKQYFGQVDMSSRCSISGHLSM